MGIALVELPGPHRAVANAGVPGLQELLARVSPPPRYQDLELHRVQALIASPALGKPDQLAADAATRRSDAQLVELDDSWQRIADLEKLDDPEERAREDRLRNRDYHLVLHQMSPSRVMAQLSGRMWDLSDFLVITVGGIQRLSDSVHDRNHDHDIIRIAIRSQNPDVARAAMELHIIGTVAAFSATLDSPGAS